MSSNKDLSLDFHKTFFPDRNLISKLLAFTKNSGFGSKEEISEATGIPTGASSGKVEPMIDYAYAMGLIAKKKNKGIWQLSLTDVGETVYKKDPYLKKSVSPWLMHLMMCRRYRQQGSARGLADTYFALFADRGFRFGHTFDVEEFAQFLNERHPKNPRMKRHATMTIRTYEQGVLQLTNALSCNTDGLYQFNAAPNRREFYPLYAAFFLVLWDEHYPEQQQILLSELFEHTRLLTLLNWTHADIALWLDWMVDHRVIQIDRQTGDALALRLQSTQTSKQAIQSIYSELL